MASAFISYAHEDQEFVFSLVEHLQGQGLDIRYDQVVLHIGDSLIRAVSQEIADGDYLIAIVSPDSVHSEWCQHELAIARTQGINERRVKVLPVRFRGAEMPAMLSDTFWGDADHDDVETLALRLAASIRANLQGRGEEADREAEQVRDAGGEPPHGEMAGDVGVVQIEEVAQRVWDVLEAWSGVWNGGNTRDLEDPQRRLRWALDVLPDRIRGALPLVERLANADWDGFFGTTDSGIAESEIRSELRSARTRVAQGLPVTRRWVVIADLGQVDAGGRDATAYLWRIQRGEEARSVTVFISGTAMVSADERLPQEIVLAKHTLGRSVLTTVISLDDPPAQVMVTTAGISSTVPD